MATEIQEIDPPAVFARVGLLRKEIDLIRYEMGAPRVDALNLSIHGAQPREVFFQALTLFRKVDRLGFELTAERSVVPETPRDTILPAHVFEVIDAALEIVYAVKKELHIEIEIIEPLRDDAMTPTDVFQAIIQVNRQLNLLLTQRFSPADVFQQVTLAMGCTAHLLAQFPNADTLPRDPEFERGKSPPDVFRKLLACYELVRNVASLLEVETLELDCSKTELDAVTPSDVYDIATLLLSEIAFLHANLRGVKYPKDVRDYDRKFPAHVYQRVGALETQLNYLSRLVDKNPKLLSDKLQLPKTGTESFQMC